MYSRQSPSSRYNKLQEQYRQLHLEGSKHLGLDAESTFPGNSLYPHIKAIKELIEQTGSEFILDYGCGKGMQYQFAIADGENGEKIMVIDYWDITGIHCYDPCYQPFSQLPEGKFDGVISTDVLEHCPEEDIPWILEEMFSYADKFFYANVACYPALHHLPNGENAHCTIQSKEWWENHLEDIGSKYSKVKWQVELTTIQEDSNSGQKKFVVYHVTGN